MEKLLKKWKSILGLDDWTIVLKDNCTPADFDNRDVCGHCEYSEMLKCAVISIIDEKYCETRVVPYDKEKTLLHELLHIKFCFLQESGDDLQERIVHQLIEELARAFVKAKGKQCLNDC